MNLTPSVIDQNFVPEKIDLFDTFIENLKRINISGPDAQVVLRALYDTTYRIHKNVNHKQKPLITVAFSGAEDVNKLSVLESFIRNYGAKDINNIFGLNLIEYLELPFDIAEMIVDVANDRQLEKVKQIQKIQKDEEKLTKELLGTK